MIILNNCEYKCWKGYLEANLQESTILVEDKIEKVEKFCTAIIARVRRGWKMFEEVWSVFCGRKLSLKVKGIVYESGVTSKMCYGAEYWQRWECLDWFAEKY